MASVAGSSTAAQRRAAQNRLSREIKSGTYRRGEAGRAYQSARRRQRSGRDRGTVEVGNSGVYQRQREFKSITDAADWGVENLPPRTNAYIIGYGRLITQSGDPDDLGQFAWRALTDFTKAGQLRGAIPDAEAEASRLFTDLRSILLRWAE